MCPRGQAAKGTGVNPAQRDRNGSAKDRREVGVAANKTRLVCVNLVAIA
jgi:hypothetical protein